MTKRIFDEGGQHEVQTVVVHRLTGDLRLYVLTADHEDNDKHVDRMLCVHVFDGSAESVTPTLTATRVSGTSDRPERVFRLELCAVCLAMHQPNAEQLAEYQFRGALVRIMDEPPDPAA